MELYKEDLLALVNLMEHVEAVSQVEGVFEAEVRVRIDDMDNWIVLGWGESGDPCVLRIEDKKTTPWLPHQTLPGVRSPGITTINRPLGSSDYNIAGDIA